MTNDCWELRVRQKRRLYELLFVLKVMEQVDKIDIISTRELRRLVHQARVEMDAEDISHVEKETETAVQMILFSVKSI